MNRLKISELDSGELTPVSAEELPKVVGGISSFDVDFDVDFDIDLSVERQGSKTIVFIGKSFARADAKSTGGRARARARARQNRA